MSRKKTEKYWWYGIKVIAMEYQEIINSLDNTQNDPAKSREKN